MTFIKPYQGNDPYIFISYSHKEDQNFIDSLLKKLADADARFWYDVGIEKGEHWMGEIGQKIQSSSVVLALISRAYLDSYYCNREIEYAINLKKTIIPCYLEEVFSEEWDWLLAAHQAIHKYSDTYDHILSLICEAPAVSTCRMKHAAIQEKPLWGPKRPLFAMDNLPDRTVFNSMYDNPEIGDERYFVRIREADSQQPYARSISVEPGKYYEVRIDYHNNADPQLNPRGIGIADGVVLHAEFPHLVTAGKYQSITAKLLSATCKPSIIWAEVSVTTASVPNVELRFVRGSATVHNRGYRTNNQVLAESLFKEEVGVLLGVNKLDGRLPGGLQFAGYVTYRLYCAQLQCNMEKLISTDGIHFTNKAMVHTGDVLTFKTIFRNVGTSDIMTVAIRDRWGKELELISGTTTLLNMSHPKGLVMDDLIGKNGYRIGNYAPGTTAEVTYKARVVGNPPKYDDEMSTIWYTNTSYIDHSGGEIFASVSYMML